MASGRIVSALQDLIVHDLFGKPVSTFPDHALAPDRSSIVTVVMAAAKKRRGAAA
jgi:hypothetical protein